MPEKIADELISVPREMLIDLWAVVQVMAEETLTAANEFDGSVYCPCCLGEHSLEEPDSIKHNPNCIILKARSLMEKKPGSL